MKLNLIILLTLITFSSCISARKRAKICATCPVSVKDSIVNTTSTIVRDTTIYITIQGEPVIIDNPCDTNGILKPFKRVERNNGLITTIEAKDGKLTARCDADSLSKVIEALTKIVNHSSSKDTVKTIEVNRPTKFQGFTFWWFWITVVLLLFWIGKNYLLRYLKKVVP